MIATLLRVSRISLSRDRVAQAMSFLLPIAFFSIFALVFGQQRRAPPAAGTPRRPCSPRRSRRRC